MALVLEKVWTTTIFQGEAAVRAQVLKTIQDLDCDFLDLYCVHWPVPGKHVDAYVALQVSLEQVADKGLLDSKDPSKNLPGSGHPRSAGLARPRDS